MGDREKHSENCEARGAEQSVTEQRHRQGGDCGYRQFLFSLITTHFNMQHTNQCHICHLILTDNAPVWYIKCDNAMASCIIPLDFHQNPIQWCHL